MSEDFRVRVTMSERREAAQLGESLQSGELEHGLAAGPAGRVAVSVDGHEVFLYADTREQAAAATAAVDALAKRRGWHAQTELRRWHPVAEKWEDADDPLPRTDAELASERSEEIARERADSEASGIPEYEVRIACPSHRATLELAERLRSEGVQSLRRWRYLLVGALDQDSARALADRLTGEVPAGTTVTVEGTLAVVARETPANPFAVFGGIAG